MLAYNNAIKIKEVPVPFAYVQFNALILNTFNLLGPIAIARFTEDISMSVITAALITGGFTAMWLVANELEDPFGADHNDLPVLHYHESFCGGMRALLRWCDEDTWTATMGGFAHAMPVRGASNHVAGQEQPEASGHGARAQADPKALSKDAAEAEQAAGSDRTFSWFASLTPPQSVSFAQGRDASVEGESKTSLTLSTPPPMRPPVSSSPGNVLDV